jgi:hypothetical protein
LVLGYRCADGTQADVEKQNLGDLLKRRGEVIAGNERFAL